MVRVYANLIEKGLRNINSVPTTIREDVRAQVIADGYYFDKDGWAHRGIAAEATKEVVEDAE